MANAVNPWFIDPIHITIRLVLAFLLGGFIGFEREQSSHAAGMRTHILVCVGSTLIMLLSIYGFSEFTSVTMRDPARLAAQVISGIGFLGAGTIMFTGKSITGLTTAASLWVVAAIGLAIGAGFYYAAALTVILVLISLFVLNQVEKKYFRAKKVRHFKLKAVDTPSLLARVSTMVARQGGDIQKLSVEELPSENENDSANLVLITLTLRMSKDVKLLQTVEDLKHVEGVKAVACD
ncbi:MgtC/SapB family protein [Paenibacillus cremeus]|uniref:MgtC/SapB family protein n=1 Tax=Paenibacillus cremeus TaxID=2163881 RepID=A0A559JMH0_9BACL|nr:MgtC/SapB family protein [Paenibacillus cremeus]TVY01056.1 MgtC/SapB family protein [Paenibacillus cremeus]